MTRRRGFSLICALLAGALTGCSTPADLPGDSWEALGPYFGACSQSRVENTVDAAEYVAATTDWVQVQDIVEARRSPDGQRNTQAGQIISTSGDPVDIRIHYSLWPGIDWAIANGGEAWLAMADPELAGKGFVDYVMVVTSDGNVFFPGDCQDQLLTAPLHQRLGDRADQLLAELPHLQPGVARPHLGVAAPPQPDPRDTILNPQDADPALLATLRPVGIDLSTTAVIGDGSFTICSRIAAGWNDCARADRVTTEGVGLSGFVDDSGILEFWLLDADADVSAPLGKLGQVSVAGLASPFTVVIDTSDIDPTNITGSANLVTVTK